MGDYLKDTISLLSADEAERYGMHLGAVGIPTHPFEKQLEALQARIRSGARVIELGFMGQGKGSVQGNITPGMHSREEREDMRELAKINKLKLSTHASANVIGLSGLTQRGFNDEEREKHIREIERSIDFAGDVARGGPVVVHTGEFIRPIHGAEKEKEWKEKIVGHPEEPYSKVHFLVNKHTGELIRTVREDEELWEPVAKTDEKTKQTVYKLGPDGKPMQYEDVTSEEAEKEKRMIKIPIYEQEEDGRIKVRRKTFDELRDELRKENPEINDSQVAKKFLAKFMQGEMEHSVGQADEYEMAYRREVEKREILLKRYKELKEVEDDMTEEAKKEYLEKVAKELGVSKDDERELLEEKGMPSKKIERMLWDNSKQISYGQEIAISSRKNEARLAQSIKDTEVIDDYAIKKSADSMARLALFAKKKEDVMAKQGTPVDEPLFIAPENVFPEQYGAHPDELKNLVQKSREKLVEYLTSKEVEIGRKWDPKEEKYVPQMIKSTGYIEGMSKEDAKKFAAEKIRATFDIGHVNTWRKYFQGTDEEFNKWVMEKAKTLVKEGIIGHVHLSDNFGYEDEHVHPGGGNAPIGDFIKAIKEAGYTGQRFLVESGAQGQGAAKSFEALKGALRSFNSPIYAIDGASKSWADIESGYFGKAASPSFVVGAYAPDFDIPVPQDQKMWFPWSGMPFE